MLFPINDRLSRRYFFMALACTWSLPHLLFAQCPVDENDLADGGTFSGNCIVNVGNDIEITGVVIWESGRLTINGGAGHLIVANDGSVTIQDGATLDLDDGDLSILNGGALTVESGGSVEVLDNNRDLYVWGDLVVASGASLQVADFAYIQNTGDVSIAGQFITGDDVEINGGRVVVKDGGTLESGDNIDVYNNGVLRIDEGATASTSGEGGDLTNSGEGFFGESQGTIIVNGTLTISDDVVIADTEPSSILAGSGTITVENEFTDEENGVFSNCGGDEEECTAEEPGETCDETTVCTPGDCPTENELAAGGVFCGDCVIDVGGWVLIDNDICWVGGDLVLEGGDFFLIDEATLTIVGGSITIEDGGGQIVDGNLVVLAGAEFEVDDELVVNEDGNVDISGEVTTGSGGGFGGGFGLEIDGGAVIVRDGGTLTSGDDLVMDDDATLVIQEGGTVNIIDGGDLENDGPATVVVDGVLNVDDDVDFNNTNPNSTITGTGTINVDGDFDDGDGGTFSDCNGGESCEAEEVGCDENTVCTENNCPLNENDLENGGTFCGECYLNIGNTIDIEADVCWVSGTLTLDGNGSDGEFDLEEGVTFTVVSGAVIIEDGGVDVTSGATLHIMEDASFFVGDEVRIAEAGTVIVNGVLQIDNNVDIGETTSGTLLVDGGEVYTEAIDNDTPGDLSELPNNIIIQNGGVINSDGVPLPVVLVSFTASLYNQGQDVLLQWQTASEVFNAGFYVERSLDGHSFEQIEFVTGNGDTQLVSNYEFVDGNLTTSAYYRLRQVDYDGHYEFSPMVYITKAQEASVLKRLEVYPNPSSGQVVFDGLPEGIYNLWLVGLTGRILLQVEGVSPQQAEVMVNRALQDQHSGTYLVKFVSPDYAATGMILRN